MLLPFQLACLNIIYMREEQRKIRLKTQMQQEKVRYVVNHERDLPGWMLF